MRYYIFLFLIVLSTVINAQQGTDYQLKDEYRKQINDIVSHNQVMRAFALIDQWSEQTKAYHIDLTEIEAPPFKEMSRATAFMDLMSTLQLDSIWMDEVGNVFGLLRGTLGERTVVLDAHLDTVFPEGTDVTVKVKNDTLFAPGIGDDTRALASLLTVVRAVNESKIRFEDDVIFVASVGEEGLGDLRGVKHIFSNKDFKIDSWISIDGGQIENIYTKALGSYRYRVTFIGPGGHSWGAFGLVNPHHALGLAINEFVKSADQFTSYGPRTSYNIGVIGGGTSVNSIPYDSWMEIDIRSHDPLRLDSMENILYQACAEAVHLENKLKRLGPDIKVEIDKIGNRPSGEMDHNAPLVQRTIASCAYFGKRPILVRGSTNSNIPISLHVPSVTIGRGGVGAYAHSLDEWWYPADADKAIKFALLVLISEAGLE